MVLLSADELVLEVEELLLEKLRKWKNSIIIIIIIIYLKTSISSTPSKGWTFAHMKSLHISLNTAHSGCNPSTSMSSFTHSLQVFLFLPLHLTPATSTFLQADTQSSTLVRFRCPNHLNLPCLTTSATLYTQKTVQIHTALSILQRHSARPSHHHPFHPLQTTQIFSLHCPCFSPICQHTLDTSSVYLSFYVVLCTTSCQDRR